VVSIDDPRWRILAMGYVFYEAKDEDMILIIPTILENLPQALSPSSTKRFHGSPVH
jgi:hypothetical protein